MEFADLLERKFGSSNRVDRTRAEVRTIRQGRSEIVRAYSTRFEALLGKLPSWDADWAKSHFIWGLPGRVAELVTIASPGDLFSATHKAEQVEFARQFAYSGGAQQQPRGAGWHGRGWGSRGDGHGIPKCSPCPSVFFLYHRVRPSVSVFFLGGEYVCPSYGPLKFLKSAKSGRKSVRPLIKELRNPFLPKNFKKSLNYGRCNI